MRIIGVIDLLGGRAVHAQAGRRERYAPVQQVAGCDVPPGDAVALAHAYVNYFGVDEIYVADLDAIMTGTVPHAVVHQLAGAGVPFWLDAGVTSVEGARHARSIGAAQVVVGLETLASFDALASICRAIGPTHTAFSLDLRNGAPLRTPADAPSDLPVDALVGRAVETGIGALIVLDLARVGMGTGPDLPLMASVRASVPDVMLIGGGGVRGSDDLGQLAAAGCDGVLVATALLSGRLQRSVSR